MKKRTPLCLLVLLVTVFSCHKKFNFNEAYQFNLPERYMSHRTDTGSGRVAVDVSNLEASLNSEPAASITRPEEKAVPTSDLMKKSGQQVVNTTVASPKEVKKALKEVKKDLKEIKKANRGEEKQASYLMKGLILVIGGLLLIVGGILLINPIGLILGSILAGIGLIVFLIGFLGLLL